MARNFGKIKISDYARLSINPLRKITQEQKIDPNPSKRSITLQLGDPTIFGKRGQRLKSLKIFKSLFPNFFFI